MSLDVAGWSAFLHEWDRDALDLLRQVPTGELGPLGEQVIDRGTILRDPAPEDDIRRAEERLGSKLPPSVRDFYRASNGMAVFWFDAEPAQVWPVARLVPAREADPEFVSMNVLEKRWCPDTDYFTYGPGQRSLALRSPYFETLIQLTGRVDAATLQLNPRVVTPAGEWEAWFWGDKLPGARRYPRFDDLMADLHRRTIAAGRRAILPMAGRHI